MKRLLFIAVLALVGCGQAPNPIPTYEELLKFPRLCTDKDKQLSRLAFIQQAKHFAPDPDDLNMMDRLYNSQLKDTIWWYYTECNNDKSILPSDID